MPTETNCPNCRQALSVPDAPQGRLAKCAFCGSIFPLAEALAANGDPREAAGGNPASRQQPLQSTAPGFARPPGEDPEAPSPSPPAAENVERDDESPGRSEPAPVSSEDAGSPEPSSPTPLSPGSVTPASVTPDSTTQLPLPREAVPSPAPPAEAGPEAREYSAPAASAPAVAAAAPSPAGWYLRIPEGRTYGPADRVKLERWLQEGRIDADCFLREGDRGDWLPAASIFPELASSAQDQPEIRRQPAPSQPALPQTAYAPRTQGHGPAASQGYAPGYGPSAGQGYSPQAVHGQPHAGANRDAGGYFAGHPVRRTATSDSYSASPYGGQPNATGSPFRSSQVQPHRGEIVFLLGLFGMLLGCPVFSGAAWYLGGSDLKAMNLGLMNPDGRGLTTFGYVLGIVVSCFWIVAVLVTMLIVSVSILTQ